MHDKAIIKSRVIERAEHKGVEATGTPEYQDLLQNIEGEVQQVLEEEGIIEF